MIRGNRKQASMRKIGIPKGLLLHITMSILKQEPMSGSELMEEIKYYTDWRPSPGSVYPLLSKLEKQGIIELVESDDPSLKRYALTKSGVRLTEERRKLEPNIRSRFRSIQKAYWMLFRGMNDDLFEAVSKLFEIIDEAYSLTKGDEETSHRFQALLYEIVEELSEVYKQGDDPR
jgi:DNA-binding PadR family transcriptional regulator